MNEQSIHGQSHWQVALRGEGFVARPMVEADFDALFEAASDPLIWEQHPVRDRHQRPQFEIFFRSGMESNGALVFRDPADGRVIGASRFCAHDPVASSVEIGYTFLVRSKWGSGLNRRIKDAMLAHAFARVEHVDFVVGVANLRSRRAVEKLGARLVRSRVETQADGRTRESVIYRIDRNDWRSLTGTKASASRGDAP